MIPSDAFFDWNEANVATLVSMRQAGKGFPEICRVLGCRRNQAIGKFTRLREAGFTTAPVDPPARHVWTAEQVAYLEANHGKKLRSEIAEHIGCTAKAVGDKIKKLKRKGHDLRDVRGDTLARINAARMPVKISPRKVTPGKEQRMAIVAEHRAQFAAEAVETHEGYSLFDLPDNGCRWPAGDPKQSTFAFCGHKQLLGKPYCPEHHKRSVSDTATYRAANRFALTYRAPTEKVA